MSMVPSFEDHRTHLLAVAFRMLGNNEDSEDAVQEAWLRLNRATPGEDIANPRGWLTTVVARVCLDKLRSRKSRREDELTLDAEVAEAAPAADELLLADSVGVALMVLLETLSPAERVALVLHDMFDLSFDDVASVLGKSSEAARQLASRARRRVRQASSTTATAKTPQSLVQAFLEASRSGNLAGLLDILAPGATVLADAAAIRMGSAPLVQGAQAVAETFKGRAQGAQFAFIDGVPGLLWLHGGSPRVVFRFHFEADRVSSIDLIADPETCGKFELTYGHD